MSQVTPVDGILTRTICCQQRNRSSDEVTLLKLPSSAFSRTFLTLSTVTTDDIAALVLLDLSAAFDTVERRPWNSAEETAGHLRCRQDWRSFDHTSLVANSMSVAAVNVLPALTSLWCATRVGPWSDTVHNVHCWSGVDCRCSNTPMTINFTPRILSAHERFFTVDCRVICVDSMSSWMCSNRLQLNADKIEVMWCSSARELTQLPSSPLSVAGALVHPVTTV